MNTFQTFSIDIIWYTNIYDTCLFYTGWVWCPTIRANPEQNNEYKLFLINKLVKRDDSISLILNPWSSMLEFHWSLISLSLISLHGRMWEGGGYFCSSRSRYLQFKVLTEINVQKNVPSLSIVGRCCPWKGNTSTVTAPFHMLLFCVVLTTVITCLVLIFLCY